MTTRQTWRVNEQSTPFRTALFVGWCRVGTQRHKLAIVLRVLPVVVSRACLGTPPDLVEVMPCALMHADRSTESIIVIRLLSSATDPKNADTLPS